MTPFEHPRIHAQQPVGLNGAALARIDLSGFNDLAGHQPRRRLFVLARTREHHNLAVAGGIELLALVALGDIAQQPGQQCLMDGLVGLLLRQLRTHLKAQLSAGDDQLTMDLAPLAHAHIGKVLALTELAQLVLAECLALLLVITPQRDPRQKVRARMLKPSMGLIGLRLFIGGSLAWILNRHSTDNHQHLGQTPLLVGREQHASQPGVDRQAR